MTIQILVKNNDSRAGHTIVGEQRYPDGRQLSPEFPEAYKRKAGPGETIEFHVHDGNQVWVRELAPNPMKEPTPPMFPKDTRVQCAPGTSRGPEDGLPWDPDREPAVGTSLGFEYTAEGGQRWTAVKWNDQEDPDWHKTDCLQRIAG